MGTTSPGTPEASWTNCGLGAWERRTVLETWWDEATLEEFDSCAPCFACVSMGREGEAEWIVHYSVKIASRPFDFICSDCKARWIAHGFGTVYDLGARWERL